MGSEPRNTSSSRSRYLVCSSNEGYPASLEVGKLYEAVADRRAGTQGYVRVIDESGEDYLYAKARFVATVVPRPVTDAIARARRAGPARARAGRPARS